MANYIMQIFRAYAMVVFSWGFENPTVIANGIRFKVRGFKFQGTVKVEYNEGSDLFDISLSDGTTVESVYVDSLIQTIDNLVEKTDNYHERIKQEYNI